MLSNPTSAASSTRVGILIPTFNRCGYLQRYLIHLNNFFDQNYFEVLVADGSNEIDHASENKKLCSDYGVRYEHYSPDDYTAYQRIHDGLCKLGTEYFQLLGDDDFLNPIAIKKCVAHLDCNSDCVAAFGHYIQFNIKQNKSKLIVRQPTARSNCSYDQDCPFERLFWAMVEIPHTLYYAVKRTAVEIATLSSVMEFDCGNCDFLIGDPLASSLTLLKGKMTNINLPYLSRQTGQSVPRKSVLAGDEMLAPNKNFEARYARARVIMLNHLDGCVDKELAGKAIDAAWGSFLGGFCLSPSRMHKRLGKIMGQMDIGVSANKPQTSQDKPPDVLHLDAFSSQLKSKQHNFACSLTPNEVDLLKEYDFSIPFISKYHQLTQLKIKDDRGFFWLGALEPRTVVC